MYKKISLVLALCIIQLMNAQTAFHNFGNIQIHDQGKIGFHTHLINDGVFDNNLGLAGFYGDTQLNVSGSSVAEFFNTEIDVLEGLNLETSLGTYNHVEFINGKVFTPRNNLSVTFEFLNADYSGDSDSEHVDGYVTLFGSKEFTFPIGDADKLRSLSISEPNSISTFKSAYFFEDPNAPTIFATQFDTDSHSPILSNVNDKEFWDLNGDKEVEVTLTWDTESVISDLTDNIQNLRVVGWSPSTLRWVDLGRSDVSGDFDNGSVTSTAFTPNDYVVLTIAAEPDGEITINTGFSPNGDGLNDHFEIEGLDLSQENTIKVFDRWGGLLYQKDNYDNSWGGLSENNLTIDNESLVPVGTYYYILKVRDSITGKQRVYKGWVYINY